MLPCLDDVAGHGSGKRLTGTSFVEQQGVHSSLRPGARTAERLLLLLFLFSLPLLNPWVRGDGVGYYAFARAPLFAHSFYVALHYLGSPHPSRAFCGSRAEILLFAFLR